MTLTTLIFFCTAFLYASVGFGGGSTYNAVLVLTGADYRLIPLVALSCNIIVVTGGLWHFYRHGHLQFRRLLPLIFFSVPASFIGGLIPIPKVYFIGLLGCALLFAGIRLLWPEAVRQNARPHVLAEKRFAASIIGSILGLLAGVTGIGGGIFLAPVLHLINWGSARQIAGGCAFFILVNSLSGITGQLFKLGNLELLAQAAPYWVLLPAVLIGGQGGSWLGAGYIKPHIVKKMTGLLILYVAARLLVRFWQMTS
jgi:uncharacterized membrane protein YfcA